MIIIFLVTCVTVFHYNFNHYLVLLLISSFVSFLKYDNLKKITFFILPLITTIHGYIILVLLILLLIKSNAINKYQLIPPLVLTMIELFHFILNGTITDIMDFIFYISCIFMFFFLLFDNKKQYEISNDYIKLFCYSLSIVLFIVTYNMLTTYGITETFSGIHRDGSTMGNSEDGKNIIGVALNANSIGYFSLAAITLLFLGNKKLNMPYYVYLLCYIISIIAGIISFSRAWMILTTMSFILFILFNNFNLKKKIIFMLVIACISVVIINTNYGLFQNIFDVFYSRFTNSDITTAGNRTNISTKFLNFLSENTEAWIWGNGLINSKYINEVSIHNGTLQILISYGIIGLFVFFFSGIMFFYKLSSKRITKIQYIPFIACFLMLQSLQFLSPYFLMFPILVSMIATKINIDINNNIRIQ